jgi:5S rRNA maturation endonuclease (ribonuclease M5)
MKDVAEYEEEFIDVIGELRDFTVVVEGRKDVMALKSLGVGSMALNGRPIESVAEDLHRRGVKEVVILSDYDREGRKIFLKLKKLLQKYRIKHNARLRRKLMEFGKTRIEDFNGVVSSLDCSLFLSRFAGGGLGSTSPIKSKRGDKYGKTGSYFHKIPDKNSIQSEGCCGKKRRDRRHIRPD